MSKQYETVFIMTPVLSEEQMSECVSKFKKILTDLGSKLVFERSFYVILEIKKSIRRIDFALHPAIVRLAEIYEISGSAANANIYIAFMPDIRIVVVGTLRDESNGASVQRLVRANRVVDHSERVFLSVCFVVAGRLAPVTKCFFPINRQNNPFVR